MFLRKVEIQSYDCEMEFRKGDVNQRGRCLKRVVGERVVDIILGERFNQEN